MSSAVVAVMADAETAARELRPLDRTADQQLAPELLATAGLVRLILGMKASDAQAVDKAAACLLAQNGHPPGHRVPGLPAAVMLAQATTQFWHGRNEGVGALLRAALQEAGRSGPPARGPRTRLRIRVAPRDLCEITRRA